MTVAMVETSGLRAGYEGIEVLHGIDLRVETGHMFAILGPNGAGKTTFLNVLAGLKQPTAGEILLAGEPVADVETTALVRAGVSVVPERRGIFPNLTVSENLWMGTFRGLSREQLEHDAFERFPKLAERRGQLAGTLSGGEQQMVAVARALTGSPALVLLDELSTGLAPKIVAELLEHVAALTEDGVTVVVVEQFARAVMPIVDMAGLLVGGRLTTGAPDEIDERLHEAYFGSAGSSVDSMTTAR